MNVRTSTLTLAIAFTTLLVSGPLFGQEGATAPAEVYPSGVLCAWSTNGCNKLFLPLKKTDVNIEMASGLITATVRQRFVNDTPLLDLAYEEDSQAEVDMNVVMTGDGRFIEVQGTAEGAPFTRASHDALLALAETGIGRLVAMQRELVGDFLP